jgi:hypothetical protein
MGDQKLIAGIEKHLSKAPLVVAGKTYQPFEIIAMMNKRFDAVHATALAYAAWLNRVNDEHAIECEVRQLRTPLRQLVGAMFGKEHETLTDFGLTPRRRAPPAIAKKRGAITAPSIAKVMNGDNGVAAKAAIAEF